MTGSDTGAINVLCYEHETRTLQRILADNLDEVLTPSAAISELAPQNVALNIDGPTAALPIVIEVLPLPSTQGATAQPTRLVDFASSGDNAILSVLQSFSGPPDLPDDAGGADSTSALTVDYQPHAFVPVTVTTSADSLPSTVNVAVSQRVLRIVAGRAHRIGALDIQPSMLVADIAGPSTFDRLRELLMQTRGSVTKMLLAAWDHALALALTRYGSPRALAEALSQKGSSVGAQAVAEWFDNDRIGPREPSDVVRIGLIADHPVVRNNAPAIAETMRQLRILHQSVGRVVVEAVGGNLASLDDLEMLLGPDALSIVNEIVVYRVVHVGDLASATNRPHRTPDGENGDCT
ncbi:hypothetical protein A5722_32345 [Mycobacterium vulneris]|nr:hypothetical protein A5722_32345 [Mycolicibacterium vulneris]OCB67823.1 hypothetical protein A5729_06765 [Mycolicibacterium vulneris]